MKKLLIALVCMAFTVNAQLVGTIRVDVQGTATNSTGISGGALGTVTGIANTVVAPYTNGAALGATAVQPAALPGLTNAIQHSSLSGILGAGTLHVTAAETGLVHTAWQNPASATNWTWTSDGTQITLTGYSGPAAVVIPDTLDNLPVTGFGLVLKLTAITSVSGGANVTTVEGDAFLGCTVLTSASLTSATEFGTYALAGCHALTAVYFGQNAPAEAEFVYADTPNVTNYVTSSTATGWGATWNGRPVVRMPVYADTFYGSGAGVSNIPLAGVTGLQGALDGKLNTNGIPGPGCTYLGTSQAVTLTGATTSYRAEPAGVYTVSVAQAASRYTYALEVISTNPCTLAAGLNLQGSWTITGTNILVIVPGTGTVWRVYGRGL